MTQIETNMMLTIKRKYTKPPKDRCGSIPVQNTDGTEYECDYNPPFSCDKCMWVYLASGVRGGLNPQAKKWYDKG